MSKQACTRFGFVLAGGSGERFWPLSRHNRPKQLLPLAASDTPMLTEAIERLAPVVPRERIHVLTGGHLAAAIRELGTGIPDNNIVVEPCKRNTGGALAYATAWLLAHHPELPPEQVSIAVTTADHDVGEPEVFAATLDTALTAAEQEDALVVCGIVPSHPETGFGYIEVAEDAEPLPGAAGAPPVYPVAQFREKPDAATARRFVDSGRFYWNSGMFFWKASTFLAELDTAAPQMAEKTRQLAEVMRQGPDTAVNALFETMENISIDYALLERARRVCMVRGDFPWSDVGAWTALDDKREHDAAGNLLVGNPAVHDSKGCLVYNAPGAERMALGVVGMEDVIVVATEDGVLVMPKDRAQDVRHIVKLLKDRGARQV